ncbi:hypothetical protein EDC17_101211 [Sphingobacterium alimentarium]|uniref:Uncharacterized protein n=1 Tax=Sphingobacterium alimentarium TaxID=797292 RepID=A0A4R3VZ41_9SPHI|nr:hypothetical protein EDC17_101211 [Sphingobacterium alimentarium]
MKIYSALSQNDGAFYFHNHLSEILLKTDNKLFIPAVNY